MVYHLLVGWGVICCGCFGFSLGTYYIVNWAVAEKDNILDAHDAYYHYQFVQSWGDVLDTTQIKKELDNLRIFGSILYLNADTLCTENYVYNPEKEKTLLFGLIYWAFSFVTTLATKTLTI